MCYCSNTLDNLKPLSYFCHFWDWVRTKQSAMSGMFMEGNNLIQLSITLKKIKKSLFSFFNQSVILPPLFFFLIQNSG